jgi:hypothetical protein
MILGHDRQALFAVRVGRAIGDGPRLQDAIGFEAKVVVQSPRGVLLDDEGERPTMGLPLAWRGLRGAGKIALGAIFVEWRWSVP